MDSLRAGTAGQNGLTLRRVTLTTWPTSASSQSIHGTSDPPLDPWRDPGGGHAHGSVPTRSLHAMRSEGQSIRATANATAISRNAVLRYLTSDEAPE